MTILSVDNLRSRINQKGGVARSNRYLVELPSDNELLRNTGLAADELSLFCTSVNMPGKQITSIDRRIGTTFTKVGYGYASQDVQMSFLLTSYLNYKKYFEGWQQLAVDNQSNDWHGPAYFNTYTKSVKIYQLGQDGEKNYGVQLISAYPTTVNPIQYNNEADGLIELTIEMSYIRWQEVQILGLNPATPDTEGSF